MSVTGLGSTSFDKLFCDQNSVLDLKSQAAEWWETLGEAERLSRSRADLGLTLLRSDGFL